MSFNTFDDVFTIHGLAEKEINQHRDNASKLHFAKMSIIIRKSEDDKIDQSLIPPPFFCYEISKTLVIF